ncbi:universal stress protein [Nonomuraea sp. KC401]|uniref:Universal stress protein n=1 Tax=Nonomuraea longispora TaxID=1848320 RepID=A0A4R4NA78_9ACTN|nr:MULTISPECIES: universal stress protein [Nonomuraea]NBE95920.1 universal stress protein [Nonomuraea sp. K271]TDC05795.1 universal stress protein [Nonomuraea longispora]TLF76278.1 universal stress protein [Nonomuraea sp. KC401]
MVIVGVDGSVASRAAVEWAADDAFRMRVPLRIVHAVDPGPYPIGRYSNIGLPELLWSEGRRILSEAEELVRERRPTVEVTTRIVEGGPAVVLREQADDATEIVVGSRGLGGFAGALLGSVSTYVAGHVRCPVVVVRGESRPARGEIVVGVDDTPEGEPALAYAFRQAELREATLRAVHAWQLPVHAYAPVIAYDMDEIRTAQHRVVRDRLAAFARSHPEVKIMEDTRSTHPVDALTDASGHADLLVVGSHGRGFLGSMLLGSVSRGVLHHARCPVAVVRA